MKSIILYGLLSISMVTTGVYADKTPEKLPAGFNQYLVYMANGVFNPNNTNPIPGVTCQGLFCNGEYFQSEIMGRTPSELEAHKQQAKDFFAQRFGLDVDDPRLQGRIVFSSFMTHPDWHYRMYTMGNTSNPDGWEIRDGGYNILVTDPNGVDLGGEFIGQHAPVNSTVFFGTYNILLTDLKNNYNDHPVKSEEIIIDFKSLAVHQIRDDGSVSFRCELSNEKWGSGYAAVVISNIPRDDGLVQGRGRNVLTFPSFSESQ